MKLNKKRRVTIKESFLGDLEGQKTEQEKTQNNFENSTSFLVGKDNVKGKVKSHRKVKNKECLYDNEEND